MIAINPVILPFIGVLILLDALIVWRARIISQGLGWRSIWSYFITGVLASLIGIIIAVLLVFLPMTTQESILPGTIWFGSIIISSALAFIFVYKFSDTFKKQLGKG